MIETGSAWVRSLVHARATHDLYIARLTAVEVTSAITRRQHSGHLSRHQADAMLGHFRRHLAQRYHIIDVTPALLEDAMRAARKHRLRAYDAVQLAAVVVLHQHLQAAGRGPLTLVSADQALNDAATAERLTVDDPRSHP